MLRSLLVGSTIQLAEGSDPSRESQPSRFASMTRIRRFARVERWIWEISDANGRI